MKHNKLSLILPAMALVAFNSFAGTPAGTGRLTISWTVSQGPSSLEYQSTKNTVIKKGTNDIGTNSVNTFTAATHSTIYDNASILALLSHSFNASFTKPGYALAIDVTNGVYVVDGTTVISNVSSIVSVALSNSIVKGKGNFSQLTKKTGANTVPTTTYGGSETETEISYTKVTYDDSKLITDGTASTFTFTGIVSTAVDISIIPDGAEKYTENFTLSDGSGAGMILGTNSIITGSVTGGPISGIAD